jgi:hypothetical protein
MRKVMHLGLVVSLALVLTACLTAEQQTTAKSVALGDRRFQELLAHHPYAVDRVVPRGHPSLSLDVAFVDIRFGTALAAPDYVADVCETISDGPYRGIRWMIDLKAKTVMAVTPIATDGRACFEP